MEKPGEYTTEVLAAFTQRLNARDLSAATMETVQRCMLDLIGSAAAGSRSDAAVIARDSARRLGAKGKADIWFGGGRYQAAPAAFVNSTAASALDVDDGHRTAGGHPGAAVIPAVLAVAQEVRAGWADVAAALTAGYDVSVRVSAARDFSRLDTFSTGRWCGYGVVAAASRLRRYTVRQTAEAMALAGVLSPGLSAAGYSKVMGNHAKEGIPWATMAGLWAADLAARGFTGPLDILDHPDYYDATEIVMRLGEGFALDSTYFKPYACCRWIHSALDGLCRLLEEHSLKPTDIRSIEVHTFERMLRLNNYPDPENLESAQYSAPFCLAAAAVEGKKGLLPMRKNLLHRPDIVTLANRVSLKVESEFDRMFPERAAARVIIQTAAERLEAVCHHPLGDPANPMDWRMLVDKFHHLTKGLLPTARQEEVIKAVRLLPEQGLLPLLGCLAEPLS